jgi:hypothetical protein
MTVNEHPVHARRGTKIRLLKDMVIGAIAIPIGLVALAGIVAYVMYLLF